MAPAARDEATRALVEWQRSHIGRLRETGFTPAKIPGVTVLAYYFREKERQDEDFWRTEFAFLKTFETLGALPAVIVVNEASGPVKSFCEKHSVELQIEKSLVPGKSQTLCLDMVRNLHRRISTDYVLIIQDDGFPLRDGLEKFLGRWDYIGAPWVDRVTLYDFYPRKYRVGNGGFSLRSRRLCKTASEVYEKYISRLPYWWFVAGDDTFYCKTLRFWFRRAVRAFKWAPVEEAVKFSVECNGELLSSSPPLGFHAAGFSAYRKAFPHVLGIDGPSFKCAPVLLLGFNRPEFMASQIAALRPAAPSKVYIAVDGPRKDRPGEAELCDAVRRTSGLIDWPCEIKTFFREENAGCKCAVSGAITWFFENETCGIVLEDDCRATVEFLRFASEMLVRYENNPAVGAVCGFNFFNLQTDQERSYHFSRHIDVWGWASWRRVWKDYKVDVESDGKEILASIDAMEATEYYRNFYRKMFYALKGGLSTWDVQFSFLFILKKYLSVVPRVRLVSNVGLSDPRATHTGGYVYWNRHWSKAGSIAFPLVHPGRIVCDDAADAEREKLEGALVPRALTWTGSKFPSLIRVASAAGWLFEKIFLSKAHLQCARKECR